MELLVKRDFTLLEEVNGKSNVGSDVPKFLRAPKTVRQCDVEQVENRSPNDDLLILDEKDVLMIKSELDIGSWRKHPLVYARKNTPALWSGYRSALVHDSSTGKWYRLKGVSLNSKKPVEVDLGKGFFRIAGGQYKDSAEFEQKMSDRFNSVLLGEGIEPVMRVKGMWEYPIKCGKETPTASIIEVKGDTRFDELIGVFEGLHNLKVHIRGTTKGKHGEDLAEGMPATPKGERFYRELCQLSCDIGFTVGRLKKLMDRSGQTWSSEIESTNAHWGNIVVYNGSDKLKVGLVDFDASGDIERFSQSRIKRLQKKEYECLMQTAFSGTISPRQMTGKPYSSNRVLTLLQVRQAFAQGFMEGYDFSGAKVSNEIDLGRLQELMFMLRAYGDFTLPLPRGISREKVREYDEIGIGTKGSLLEGILKKQHGYQRGLGNSYIDFKDGILNGVYGSGGLNSIINPIDDDEDDGYGFLKNLYRGKNYSLFEGYLNK